MQITDIDVLINNQCNSDSDLRMDSNSYYVIDDVIYN